MQTSALRVDSDTMSLTGNHGCDMGTTGDKTYIRKTVVFNGTSIGKSWTIYRKPWFKLVLMDCFTENVYETIEFYPHFFSGVPDFVPPFRIDITKQKTWECSCLTSRYLQPGAGIPLYTVFTHF
jgi:hypothetical protein